MNERRISTRRDFLRSGLTLVGMSATVPTFLGRSVLAMAGAGGAGEGPDGARDRILVVVQLAGGNDGLNTIVPFRDDAYYRMRPRLAIPADRILRLHGDLGLHPAATGLRELFDEGRLAVVLGVGYPNPNRSHFASTDIWETASPDGACREGWIGRGFDPVTAGAEPAPAERAIALTSEIPLAFHGREFRGIAFTDPRELRWKGDENPAMAAAFEKLNTPRGSEAAETGLVLDPLAYLTRVAVDAQEGAARIRDALRLRTKGEYPRTAFGASLASVAKMIGAGLPTRVYYVSIGSFDTHANQPGRHERLLGELASGMRAFLSDMAEQGNVERVLAMTFSEFGRRVEENASGGTDHGTAAPLFLFGGRVRPGIHGREPSLERLRGGDLVHTVDFRRVYATVLGHWMGADPAPILGAGFAPMPLLET